MCNMNLIAVPLIGAKLEPSVISSAQFGSALITAVPHIFNNAMLSHSTHSKLANPENYTAEHSTRQAHTTIRHVWQLTLKMKTALHSLLWLFQRNIFPSGWTLKDLIHIRVSRFRSKLTINTFCPWIETLLHLTLSENLMNVDIKYVSHDSFGAQHRLNNLAISHCIGAVLNVHNMQSGEIKLFCTWMSPNNYYLQNSRQ